MSIDAKRAIDMYTQGKSLQEVAVELDCTVPGIRAVLVRNDIPRRPRGGNNTGVVVDESRVLSLYAQGKTIGGIANELRVGFARVSKVVRQNAGPRRYIGAGEKHFRAQLTDAAILEARVLRLDKKWSWARLARWFGVGDSALRKAIRGSTWAHVQRPQRVRRLPGRNLVGRPLNEQVVALYSNGQSVRQVAANAGIRCEKVVTILASNGIAARKSRGRSTVEERAAKSAEVMVLHGRGLSVSKIARRLSMCRQDVREALVRAGCRLSKGVDTHDVCSFYEEGRSTKEVGLRFGITTAYVLQCLKQNGVERRIGAWYSLLDEHDRTVADHLHEQGMRWSEVSKHFRFVTVVTTGGAQ